MSNFWNEQTHFCPPHHDFYDDFRGNQGNFDDGNLPRQDGPQGYYTDNQGYHDPRYEDRGQWSYNLPPVESHTYHDQYNNRGQYYEDPRYLDYRQDFYEGPEYHYAHHEDYTYPSDSHYMPNPPLEDDLPLQRYHVNSAPPQQDVVLAELIKMRKEWAAENRIKEQQLREEKALREREEEVAFKNRKLDNEQRLQRILKAIAEMSAQETEVGSQKPCKEEMHEEAVPEPLEEMQGEEIIVEKMEETVMPPLPCMKELEELVLTEPSPLESTNVEPEIEQQEEEAVDEILCEDELTWSSIGEPNKAEPSEGEGNDDANLEIPEEIFEAVTTKKMIFSDGIFRR